MKNIIFRFAVIALALVVLLSGCKKGDTKTYNSIFDCDYATEVQVHMHIEGVGLEADETEMRLFNSPMLNGTAYCVIQFDNVTDKINKIDCYMEFPADNIMNQSRMVKDEFLKMIHQKTGEYEFYPLDANKEVEESDFLAGKASMEMYIYDGAVIWNLSWFITGDVASLRLSKSIG